MKIEVHNKCSDFNSYRAARVKSLFNAESGCNFDLIADLPIDDKDWKIGVIVGASGSGKTSMGRTMFGEGAFYDPDDWAHDKPIIDSISPSGDFDAITGALAAVGLGSVPQDESVATWEPSWERAPIARPDLLQIGGALDGYKVVTKINDSGLKFSSPIKVE